ncbi:MAG: DUF4230 domain-containing protein [candidate division WOR-3 bacterium]|nr:DUF4230 domain-containing protein [candidate division WOR-3 bacterium]MCX7947345.1 DUF4230 domain-containing protein [candidate division WOR-3 bacterium]MDW8150099.1 DUF4230 domain-containing protein [candidate division WOR-3 bacterium]
MKNKLKNLNIIHVSILAFVILILLYSEFKNQVKVQNIDVVISSAKKIQKIGSLSIPYQKIVKNKKENFCSITLVIKGIVIAYLDLENVKKDNIKIKEDTVYITVPDVHFDVSIESHRVFKENTLFCDRIALINESLQKGKIAILEDLEKDNFKKIAVDNARRILKELIKSFGFKEVIFLVDTTKIL